jgi:archaellum component FlaF (FlaF/FlaG flagellin family)
VGLSVSASFAILTVALFIGAAALIEAMDYTLRTMESGVDEKVNRVVDSARTKFTILNATLNGTALSLNLTNTGSTVLTVKGVSVLVNGTYVEQDRTNATVEGKQSNIWSPNERLMLELNITAAKDQRVKVVTGNLVSQYGVVA